MTDFTCDDAWATRVSEQAAQMIVLAVLATDRRMQDDLLEYARTLSRQARAIAGCGPAPAAAAA